METQTPKTIPPGTGFAIGFFIVMSLAIAAFAIVTHRHPTLPLLIAGIGFVRLVGSRRQGAKTAPADRESSLSPAQATSLLSNAGAGQ